MKHIVVDFIRKLREAGVYVTTTEAEDCLRGWEMTGFLPSALQTVMRATLVKSLTELPVFESLFSLYFLSAAEEKDDETSKAVAQLVISGTLSDGSGRGVAGAGGDVDGFLEILRGATIPVLEDLARDLVADTELQEVSPKEIAVKLREKQIAIGWFEAENKIDVKYMKGKMNEAVYQKWQECFRFLQQAMTRELEKKMVRQFGSKAIMPLVTDANLRRRQFSHLNNAEITAVEHEISKLARKLAERPGIRLRHSRRGRVDLRRTFQEVARSGGCPIRLRYHDRVKSKVDLWLLCDVSNSVERFSRFMLQLVQAAQKRYATVRSFVFVDQAVEVTEWFRTQSVSELLEARHMRDRFSKNGLSRYDLVFEQITRQELSTISARTKIIILGDACNNWRKGEAEELARIAERAHSVYWLNPLPADKWYKGDCLLSEYEPYCSQIFECRNLEQLTNVANHIL